MDDKQTDEKIAYIYNQFFNVLLIQVRSLYEEYDENYLEEFELEYKRKYKQIINRTITEKKLTKVLSTFLLQEKDVYGLDTTDNNNKFIISETFREMGIDIATESMIIKDSWKAKQLYELNKNILRLDNLIKENNLEITSLNKGLDMYIKENKNLKIDLESKVDPENFINEIQKLKKEINHLKKGVDILKCQNKELMIVIKDKEEEINDLHKSLKEPTKVKEKTIEEIKERCNQLNDYLFKKTSEIHAKHKVVGGEKVVVFISKINKIARDTKEIYDRFKLKEILYTLMVEVDNLEILFKNNDKDAELDSYKNQLNELLKEI